MAFSVISISLDSSEESVRTSIARVILFGTILTTIPSTVPTTDLPVIHDDTPLVIVARWRSRVAAHSSPPPSPVRQILPASPGLPRRPTVLVLRGQPIPVGRPYRTQPNGVLKMLTARKSVGSLPTHRLASRYPSDYSSSDSHSDTLSYSSSRHSPSGYDLSDSPCDSPTTSSTKPSRKRCRDSDSVMDFGVSSEDGYVPYVPREVGLRVDVEDSYEPYTEPDVDSDIQADIDACIAFVDDLRARGIDVRDMVETAAKEEVESSVRGTTKVEVDPRIRPVIDDDVRKSVREEFLIMS
ncbi:hypothetical protein Tco_0689769 [Tanacetum coccineum]